jgi:hypothetical protein
MKAESREMRMPTGLSKQSSEQNAVDEAIALIRQSVLAAGLNGSLIVSLKNTTYDSREVETSHGYNAWQMQELTRWLEQNKRIFGNISVTSIIMLRDDGTQLIANISG